MVSDASSCVSQPLSFNAVKDYCQAKRICGENCVHGLVVGHCLSLLMNLVFFLPNSSSHLDGLTQILLIESFLSLDI